MDIPREIAEKILLDVNNIYELESLYLTSPNYADILEDPSFLKVLGEKMKRQNEWLYNNVKDVNTDSFNGFTK